jgi:hypothetical protein
MVIVPGRAMAVGIGAFMRRELMPGGGVIAAGASTVSTARAHCADAVAAPMERLRAAIAVDMT